MSYVIPRAMAASDLKLDYVDCVVIGAGVVGLAIARALTLAGREVLILERHAAFGTETSARNSEVIHAGLHYPAGSLKARSCVRGREMLYRYCERLGIPHSRCGKLIVATNRSQIAELEQIEATAVRNGVSDLRWLDRAAAQSLEPELECVAALLSPSTGIIDSHALMLSLLGDAENHGATLALQSPVRRLVRVPDGLQLECGDAGDNQLVARQVINAAGLGAVELAQNTVGLAPAHVPRAFLAKGNYFSLTGQAPFKRLVYPVPEPGGLGVHLTLDLGGQARFGPDVDWVEGVDYSVNTSRLAEFVSEIRKYWPGLLEHRLVPAYAGMRPKIAGPGQPSTDFRIDGPDVHGVGGLINLFGIESPGLTGALALAEIVVDLVGRD